jgi:hypothetical protein
MEEANRCDECIGTLRRECPRDVDHRGMHSRQLRITISTHAIDAIARMHLRVYRFFAGGPFWATAAFTSPLVERAI